MKDLGKHRFWGPGVGITYLFLLHLLIHLLWAEGRDPIFTCFSCSYLYSKRKIFSKLILQNTTTTRKHSTQSGTHTYVGSYFLALEGDPLI